MKDINDIMPKVPDMKWGALLNKKPTNKKIQELNNLLPHNGRWHTVYEEDDLSVIDGISITLIIALETGIDIATFFVFIFSFSNSCSIVAICKVFYKLLDFSN